ncbi:MAG: hypothetical protein ACRDJH_07500 [Thermomicrobiales bacterium]
MNALDLGTIAVSLGEFSTLVWPCPDGLIRVAVGLEDVADLEAALGVIGALLAGQGIDCERGGVGVHRTRRASALA